MAKLPGGPLCALACITVALLGQSAPELRVLFVGNSLTSVNGLPAMVERIGRADGRRIRTTTVAVNDFGLVEHWNDGRALREIGKGRWDYVVLQQGPSALEDSRVLLREYAKKFAAFIRKAGGRPALYMVWPSVRRQRDFSRVSESYALAASDVDGILLPAGDAWRAAREESPDAVLYAADDFHPSRDGSWLAALVVYCGLTARSPGSVTLPRDFAKPRAVFVAAAARALARQ